MKRFGAFGIGAMACALALWQGVAVAAPKTPGGPARWALAGAAASPEVHEVVAWVLSSHDHGGRPFAIVDKKAARLYVFGPEGGLRGAAPALLGLAPGDHGLMPGVRRDVASLAPHERTTPAGRFVSEPGRNLQGEPVVWFDYQAALAIHRLRPAAPAERRPQRLASVTAADNRISLGCVVVPVVFYEHVVQPVLGQGYSVTYVLPEGRPARELFGGLNGEAGL